MNNEYMIVYELLSKCDKLNIDYYNYLISMYGFEIVSHVIDDLVKEDDDNIYRFGIYYSYNNEKGDYGSDMGCLGIYYRDLDIISALDNRKNLVLMNKISKIAKELNDIFLSLGYMDTISNNHEFSNIVDKVNYCLENCLDQLVLKRVNELYNKYLYIRKIIVEGNLRLVILIANEYKANGLISIEDIIQYGNMKLMRAIDKFDITVESSFSNYAGYWINQSIRRNIRRIMYPTYMPEHILAENRRVFNGINELEGQLGREVTNSELSEYIDMPVSRINEIKTLFLQPFSLNSPCYSFDEDAEVTLQDTIIDYDFDMDASISDGDMKVEIEKVLRDSLTKKQLFVIKHYFGFCEEEYSIHKIASMMGVRPQAVYELKNTALKRLRKKSHIFRKIYNKG